MNAAPDRVRVQHEDFDVGHEFSAAQVRLQASYPGRCGAVATFVGLVRDYHKELQVQELFLEHYPGMTQSSIEQVLVQADERWELLESLVIHRVGALIPTDQIVLVQVASSHRPDAFAACEFIMDYLKTAAVFWKRETEAGGAVRWVESTKQDQARAAGWNEPSSDPS